MSDSILLGLNVGDLPGVAKGGGLLGAIGFWNYYNFIVTAPGTISKLWVKTSAAPGAGNKFTFTVVKNGSAQTLSVEIADASQSGLDSTHSFSVAVGDTLSFSFTPSGTPAASSAYWGLLFSSTNAKESLLGCSQDDADLPSTEIFVPLNDWHQHATESLVQMVIPCPGTLKNLYVHLDDAPGAGNTRECIVRKNGADTTVTTGTFGAADTDKNSGATSVTVAAGDLVCIRAAVTGTPTATRARFGLCFVADNEGEFILPCINRAQQTPRVGDAYYIMVSGVNQGWNTTEATFLEVAPVDFKAKAIYASVTQAPGAGDSHQYRLRDDTADTTLTVTISEGETTKGYTASPPIDVAAGSLVSIKHVGGGWDSNFPGSSISICGKIGGAGADKSKGFYQFF